MADNTRMKTMEAAIKKLFIMFETSMEEQRVERARVTEATDLKMAAIQNSIAQLLTHSQTGAAHDASPQGSYIGNDPSHGFRPPPFRRTHFDLPKFDGSDVLSWIFSVDQYFDFYRVLEEEQIPIAAMHLTGMVVPWFQMSQRSLPFRSWAEMKRAMEIEFGPSLFESPMELLFKLQQQGSVAEYYTNFVTLANRTNINPPDALRDCFISGLRADIRREVKAQCPPSLTRAVSLARLYEDKFSTTWKSTQGPDRSTLFSTSITYCQINSSLTSSTITSDT